MDCNSKLLLKTFDGSLDKVIINSRSKETTISLAAKYYNEKDVLTEIELLFTEVIAFDFQVNCFDNSIGSELGGFYEIFDNAFKIGALESIFRNRLNGFLYHNDYCYSVDDENDMLNNKENLNEEIVNIKEYRLFQQQMTGGILLIMAKAYRISQH